MSAEFRRYATVGVALVGAGLIIAPSTPAPLPDGQAAAVRLTGSDVGIIVGGTGTPIPQLNDDYVQDANALYIQRILPGATPQPVFTPEGGSPMYTGVKSLPFDTSFAQGATMLNTYITDDVQAGNTVAVYGESQSSTISGMVMPDLEKEGIPADAVKFVLVGDPSNPDGGLLERFEGLSLPSLGITFSGATPPDTSYDTTIYTQEYDGFADFPKYPINFLSDLNAFLGIQYVHPTYRALTETQLNDAIHLQPTSGYAGVTNYYLIPMAQDQVLPLLRPFENIPLVGKPLVDLLNPVLTQIVNLGYDNPDNQGWDVGQPNVATQFGLFPSLAQVQTALQNLVPAAEQGSAAFVNDLEHPAAAPSMASVLADLLSSPAAPTALPSLTDISNALTGAFAQAYSILLPTADILTALAVQMPTYDASLFAENLFSNPLDAVGLPFAADTGLVTLAAGIEFMVLEQTVQAVTSDLSGLF